MWPKYKPHFNRTPSRAGHPIIRKIAKQSKLRFCRLVCSDAGALGQQTALLPAVCGHWWEKKTPESGDGVGFFGQPPTPITRPQLRGIFQASRALCGPVGGMNGEAQGPCGPGIGLSSCVRADSISFFLTRALVLPVGIFLVELWTAENGLLFHRWIKERS